MLVHTFIVNKTFQQISETMCSVADGGFFIYATILFFLFSGPPFEGNSGPQTSGGQGDQQGYAPQGWGNAYQHWSQAGNNDPSKSGNPLPVKTPCILFPFIFKEKKAGLLAATLVT